MTSKTNPPQEIGTCKLLDKPLAERLRDEEVRYFGTSNTSVEDILGKNQRLERENERLTRDYDRLYNELRGKIQQHIAYSDRLRAALKKYGTHHEPCDSRYAPYNTYPNGRPCTCGFSEAISTAPDSHQEPPK